MSHVTSTTAAIEAEFDARIDAARRVAEDRRDAALVEAPFKVCGITLRRMTLDDYLTLIVFENAHVSQPAEPESPNARASFWANHHAQFLWYLSTEYTRDALRREAFVLRVGGLDFEAVTSGINEYLHETFAEAPRGRTYQPGEPIPPDPVGVSFAVHWISTIVERYPWSRAEIRALPLGELFQYLRLIRAEERAEAGKPLGMFDREVDRLWAEKLQQLSALSPSP